MAILKQAQAGTPVPELCREHGMSSAISPQADGAKSSLALSNQHTTCIMESQACLPHLPRTGAQFTYQASSSSHAKAQEPLVMGIQQQTA